MTLVVTYEAVLHRLLFVRQSDSVDTMPFLPLMVYSVVCAVVAVVIWVLMACVFWTEATTAVVVVEKKVMVENKAKKE